MQQLRIATYNVHGAVGLDGRRDPARQLRILTRMGADCIALQEFVNEPTPQGEPLLDHWCKSLGMRGCIAPGFERGRQQFGNAVLTRHPTLRRAEYDISAPGGRRRIVLEVVLAVHGREVRVLCVHCAVRARPRAAQYDMLIDLVRARSADVSLLVGDFNEWRASNAAFRELSRHLSAGPARPTFPAIAPALALDRIWVSRSAGLLGTRVDSARPARYASDHLPVVASVALS